MSTRILIVDDSVVVRKYLSDLLSAEPDLDAIVAPNGKVALDKIRLQSPRLVILDVEMPVMDGLQATRLIREWERHHDCSATPIIPVTADALSEHREQLLALGCDAYLSKPVSREALIPVVQANSQRRT